MTKRKLALLISSGAVLSGFAVTWIAPIFFPWSELNCWTTSIDITCGRYRYERYLWFVKWIDRVEETDMSRLHRDLFGEPAEPIWRSVSTLSPGVHNSPHYIHHGSLHAAKTLMQAFDHARFSQEAQKKVVETFFRLLQKDDNYFRADRYVISVSDLAITSAEQQTELTPDDLPEPPPSK